MKLGPLVNIQQTEIVITRCNYKYLIEADRKLFPSN